MNYDYVVFCLALVTEFNNYNFYKYVVLDIAFIIQLKKTLNSSSYPSRIIFLNLTFAIKKKKILKR